MLFKICIVWISLNSYSLFKSSADQHYLLRFMTSSWSIDKRDSDRDSQCSNNSTESSPVTIGCQLHFLLLGVPDLLI